MLAESQVAVWNSSVQRIVAQLSSVMNLVEQLELLKRGKLGVLSQHHGHVTSLIETKLILSMERALGFISKDK